MAYVVEKIRAGSFPMILLADVEVNNTAFSNNPPKVTPLKVMTLHDAGSLIQQMAVILTDEGWDVGELIGRVIERD